MSLKDVKVLESVYLTFVQHVELVASLLPLLIPAFSPPDMQPNPSIGALEAVIGEDLSLGGALEPVQADFEVCTKF